MAKPKRDTLSTSEALIEQLADLGIDGNGLSEKELIAKLIDTANKANKKNVKDEASRLTDILNTYGAGDNIVITDQDLIMRLHEAGVPQYYLHIFRNSDKDLIKPKMVTTKTKKTRKNADGKDEKYEESETHQDGYDMTKIWEKIRKSGIRPPVARDPRKIFESRHQEEQFNSLANPRQA